jgi:hypothetical protein
VKKGVIVENIDFDEYELWLDFIRNHLDEKGDGVGLSCLVSNPDVFHIGKWKVSE